MKNSLHIRAILLCVLIVVTNTASALFKPISYPEILTDDNWKKSKSLFAKAATGKSGIKGAMKKAEKAHGKIDWNLMIVPSVSTVKVGGIPLIDEYYDKAIKEQKDTVVKLRAKIKKIMDLADDEIEKYKDSKTLKKYLKHVNKVKSEADLYFIKLKLNSSVFEEMDTDFDKLRKRWQTQYDLIKSTALGKIEVTVKRAKTFISVVESNSTAKEFNKGIMTASRDIAQNITNITKFKTWEKTDPKSLSDSLSDWANGKVKMKDEATEKEVKEKIQEFSDLVDSIEKWRKAEA
jgi:hypothetical protein